MPFALASAISLSEGAGVASAALPLSPFLAFFHLSTGLSGPVRFRINMEPGTKGNVRTNNATIFLIWLLHSFFIIVFLLKLLEFVNLAAANGVICAEMDNT